MHKYVFKRLLMLIPVILGVSFLVFFIMSLAPGDTARSILGETAPQEAVEALREELGLNDPVLVRYYHYMVDLLHGDLGESYKSGQPVFSEVMARFPGNLKACLLGNAVCSNLIHSYWNYFCNQAVFPYRQRQHGVCSSGCCNPELLAGSDADYRIFPASEMVPLRR